MISVGSRDGRKRIGLGLEMEETELEEGEALSYHEENEDSTIDPDIALSYIGEKLQNVLGHFQKDFEGGVSAENLGAKFGGYGSFLPTYQRSPSVPHTRSPAEVRNYDSPRSPRKLHPEDQRQNLFASSSASPSKRSHITSAKAVPVGNSVKGNGYLQSRHADESSIKSGINKSVNDQRTLKVRIKVGSENLPTQKNSEIYSGLGLVSPSSSMDDSPATSEGQCGELLDVPEESPTSILQIMTSYNAELLLSPLSEDLIHLPEKMKLRGSETKLVDKTSRSSGMLVNGSLSNKSSQKVLEKKKLTSSEKGDDVFMDSMHQKSKGGVDTNVSPLKKEKETDFDTLGCEELVSNALKLPLLTNSHHIVADPAKDRSSGTIVRKGETFSPCTEKETLESDGTRNIGRIEKLGSRLGSSGKAFESKEGNLGSTIAACPQEDAPKAERTYALDQSDSKGMKARSAAELPNPLKQVDVQKGGSVSEAGLESTLEKSSTGGKRKQKVSQSKVSEGARMAKDEIMVESSLTSKSGKSSRTNGHISKSDSLDLQKDHDKPGDRYKEFFGDLELEDDDNESISGEMTSSGKLKNPHIVAKRSSSKENNTSKEKLNSRNSERPPAPENHPRPASHLVPPLENGQCSEAPMGMIPLVKEDWVECDKCKQWRLLPLGTNPKSLPDKWHCRMLTWLPGMNRCIVPEEETTNALRALYHPIGSVPAPASGNQTIHPYNSVVASVDMTSVDARRPAQEHQNLAAPTASGKKKHGSAKAANSADIDGSTHSSNSRKKNLGTSGKIRKLNSRDNSPSVDAFGYEHMRKSGMAEKCNDAETEKTSLVSYPDKGTNVMMKSKRESDMEGSKSSKRLKSEELHCDDENWTSDNGGVSSKAGRRSSSLSNNTTGNDRRKYDNHKDLSGEAKKIAPSSMNEEMHFPSTSGDGLPFPGKGSDEDSKKRKAKEHHGSRIPTEPISNSGRNHLHSGEFIEELSESDLRKEKKARLSKSGGKATSGSTAGVGTERKSRSSKDKHDGKYLNNTQAADYLKSDIGSVHPSVAANSSSSKVSGSRKNKTVGQEGKGSPVESVSSSPLRFANADKVTSTRKNLAGEDDFHDSGSLAVNPRRLSGGEVGGDGLTGLVKKDAVSDHITDVHNDQLCQSNQHASFEVKPNNDQSQYSGSHSKKSGKGSSSHSKEKAPASGYPDKVNIKASDSRDDSMNHVHLHDEKLKSRRNKSDEKSGTPSKGEKFISKKDTVAGTSSEISKGPSQKKYVHDGKDAIKSQDKKHDLQEEHDNGKLPKKSNQAEVYGNGKSHSLPPLARVQPETGASVPPVSGSQKENGVKSLSVGAFDNGDALKAPNQRKKPENPNGQPLRHPTPNSHKGRDVEAPSPLRRDSTSHAANSALREAKDLKHMADRLKNSGSTESIGLYFQAALKFLSGASLLETGSSEATKHNELMHSMHIYSSTAKLCEFCAHEYEKAKDMAAASLAYKCVEVAYMRVVYSSHGNATRDRNELQTALQIVPPGESPSSSASDLDNLNHQATADKAASAKVVGSPQVSGSHIITSRNRSSLLRVLNYAQDVNFAMEASKKSRTAFAAVTSRHGEPLHKDSIYSLKKALDFNFQDVEGLLRLVKIAMDAISR